MKKLVSIVYFSIALLIVVGCSDANEETTANTTESNSTLNSPAENKSTNELNAEETDVEETVKEDTTITTENSDGNVESTKKEGVLSPYSNEQIEYARVWLQLGPNQQIDELNVLHIPAGTPLNPDDETSASYPEDVIQLAGSRLVDGSITYSGNGNGTINVYNVPLRWDGTYPAGESFYREIIENTKLVNINPGNEHKIVELIKLLHIH